MFRNIRNTLFLLIGIITPLFVVASDAPIHTSIYGSNCILAGDFTTSTSDELAVRTVNEICFRRCRDECKVFLANHDPHLNHDIYNECNTSCKRGDLFTSGIREQSGSYTDWIRDSSGQIRQFSTRVKCSRSETLGGTDRANLNVYKTKFSPCTSDDNGINCPNQYKVKLMSPPGFANNEIFLCGNKSLKLTPSYRSMNQDDWRGNQSLWINRDDNPATWNARNPYFTDTGINIKDGGFLNIRYTGQYRYDADIDPEEGYYSYHYETRERPNFRHYDYECKCVNEGGERIDCHPTAIATQESSLQIRTFGYTTHTPRLNGYACKGKAGNWTTSDRCPNETHDGLLFDYRSGATCQDQGILGHHACECGNDNCTLYKIGGNRVQKTRCDDGYTCVDRHKFSNHFHDGGEICGNCRRNTKSFRGWSDYRIDETVLKGVCRGGMRTELRNPTCPSSFPNGLTAENACNNGNATIEYQVCNNFYDFEDPCQLVERRLRLPYTVKRTKWNVTKPATIRKSYYRKGGRGMDSHKLMIRDLGNSQNQTPILLPAGQDLIWADKLPNAPRISDAQVEQYNDRISWYGLKAGTYTTPATTSTLGTRTGDSDYYSNGTVTSSRLDVIHDFRGILGRDGEGLTGGRWARLGIRHFDVENAQSATFEGGNNWGDNLGGYEVDIEWKGCPYFDGERLQYGIVFDDSIYSEIIWQDVSRDALMGKEPLEIDASLYPAGKNAADGKLSFRIKLLQEERITPAGDFVNGSETPLCGEASCQDMKNSALRQYEAYNTDGQYYISIAKYEDDERGTIAQIINMVRGYFFGDPHTNTQGVIQDIFNSFVRNSDFIQAIRALLMLYIVYTGISYMIGLAPITQQDGLVRLFKIAIIITLTSDNSWEFFNKYLFSIFTDGSLELIAKLTASASLDTATITEDPSIIFDNFAEPIKKMFSTAVLKKAFAVGMSSAVGLIVMVVIFYGIYKYFMNIIRALIMYLVSVMGMAVLLMIAPIFISFILFKYTKEMFDSWLKMLMSFLFQPLFLFVCLAMFNNLLLLGLQSILSFTVCSACLVSLDDFLNLSLVFQALGWEGWDACIIPGYRMIDPSPWAITSNFGAIIFFIIIASSLQSFLDFSSRFANTVSTGIYSGINIADVAPRSIIGSALGAVASSVGMDGASRRRRENVRTSMAQRGDTGSFLHDSLRSSADLAKQMEKAMSADGLSADQKLKIAQKYMGKATGIAGAATALAGIKGGIGAAKAERFKAVYDKASNLKVKQPDGTYKDAFTSEQKRELQKAAIKMSMTTVNGGHHIIEAIQGDLFAQEDLKSYIHSIKDDLPEGIDLHDPKVQEQFMDNFLKDVGFANEVDRQRITEAYGIAGFSESMESFDQLDVNAILESERADVAAEELTKAQEAAKAAEKEAMPQAIEALQQAQDAASSFAGLESGSAEMEARVEDAKVIAQQASEQVEAARLVQQEQEAQLLELVSKEQAREQAEKALAELEKVSDLSAEQLGEMAELNARITDNTLPDGQLDTAIADVQAAQAEHSHLVEMESEVRSQYEPLLEYAQAQTDLQEAQTRIDETKAAVEAAQQASDIASKEATASQVAADLRHAEDAAASFAGVESGSPEMQAEVEAARYAEQQASQRVEEARVALETQETQLQELTAREEARERAEKALEELNKISPSELTAEQHMEIAELPQIIQDNTLPDGQLDTAMAEVQAAQTEHSSAVTAESNVQSQYKPLLEYAHTQSAYDEAGTALLDSLGVPTDTPEAPDVDSTQDSGSSGEVVTEPVAEPEPVSQPESESESEPEPEPESDDDSSDDEGKRRRIAELRQQLATASPGERTRILAQIADLDRQQ